MKINDLLEELNKQGVVFDDYEAYFPVGNHAQSFHTDSIRSCNNNDLNMEIIDPWSYQVMDEEEYHNTVEANSSTLTDFADTYGKADAKVLVILLKDNVTRYDLKRAGKEITSGYQDVEIGCTSDDVYPQLIQSFEDSEEALSELEKYVSTVHDINSTLYVIEYYVEENEYSVNEDGLTFNDSNGVLEYSEYRLALIDNADRFKTIGFYKDPQEAFEAFTTYAAEGHLYIRNVSSEEELKFNREDAVAAVIRDPKQSEFADFKNDMSYLWYENLYFSLPEEKSIDFANQISAKLDAGLSRQVSENEYLLYRQIVRNHKDLFPAQNELRVWKFKNGIEVYENVLDNDLHYLKVYNRDTYLGPIYPDTISDFESATKDLCDGYDPISSGWEDGWGNGCSLDGWGDALQEDEMENC